MERIKPLRNLMIQPLRKKFRANFFLLLIGYFCVACVSTYEAPILEQGEKLVVIAPIVVTNADSSRKFFIENRNQETSKTSKRQKQIYEVKSGDNLISIAFEYDIDFRALALANGLTAPYTIFVGQEISLDINRVFERESTDHSRLGIQVSNSSVARSQGAPSESGGLIRGIIDSSRDPTWQWPSSGRTLNNFEVNKNKGIDIDGEVGDPVFAAADGDVVFSGRSLQGIGNLVIIRHSDKFLSAYAHTSSMLVSEGVTVRGGEKIAEIGLNTSGGPMLHFEIRVNGKPSDPASLLPNR